jgi:tetratricopeptide (TPR) repeat protein
MMGLVRVSSSGSMSDATLTIATDANAEHALDAEALEAGTTLGRYRVVEMVGRGGMAVVYRGHDPDLDRSVAIKVIRNERGRPPEPGRHRWMLREARVAAAVVHPNVVEVYDLGVAGDLLYIAMEYLPRTLDEWITQTRPSWRHVLATFLDAGRGLAAAHDAGILHRDFKPSNVLMSDDGRARVADFGLAVEVREVRSVTDRAGITAGRHDHEASPPSGTLQPTRSRPWVGTPAYMSPEQFRGDEVDARADQFAFCVALYRSLYGQPPFAGHDAEELRAHVMAGGPRPAPAASPVPRWLWRVLARGMSPARDDRWPSMSALLRRLGAYRRRGRTALALAAGLGALGLVAWGSVGSAPACSGGAPAIEEVWGATRRAEIEATVRTIDTRLGRQTWGRAHASLDGYAAQWLAAFDEVCRAADGADPSVFDAQMACLDEQRLELDAQIGAAVRADAGGLLHLADIGTELRPPSRCANPSYASARTKPPANPRERARLAQLRRRLARVEGRREAGRYREARQGAVEIAAEADALGHAPLVAQTQLELGRIESRLGAPDAAVKALEAAYFAASSSGRERIQLEAAATLVETYARDLSSPQEAERWIRRASATAERQAEPAAGVDVTAARVTMALARGDDPEALLHAQEQLAQAERLVPTDDLRVADAHHALGRVWLRRGEFARAEEELHWALDLREMVLGPDHPFVADSHNALGVLANESGVSGEDVRHYELALAILEEAYGPDHPRLGAVVQNLANATIRDDWEASHRYIRRALKLREQIHGEDSPALAGLHIAVGNSYLGGKLPDDAERHYLRAIELAEADGGSAGPLPEFELGQVYWMRGDCDRAAESVERALVLAERETSWSPTARHLKQRTAGQLLWDCGADPERGLALITAAQRHFAQIGHTAGLESVDDWYARRGPAGAQRGPW